MKVIELVEKTKTVKVDNSDNAERQYRIEAQVRLRNDSIAELNNGYVYTLDGGMHLCYFNGLNNLNVNFDSMAEDRTAILAAIEEFEAALSADELV